MPYTVKSGDTLWAVWKARGGGMSWTDFKKLNAHLGNLDLIHPGDSIKLPGDKAAGAPKLAAPKPAAPAAPAPSGVGEGPSVPMEIEPGAYLAIREEEMELERQWREEQAEIARQEAENRARALELQLSMSPIDYVAYQSYLREREAEGLPTYSGASAADEDIQAMLNAFWGGGEEVAPQGRAQLRRTGRRAGQGVAVGGGGGGGDILGVGEFGVGIPRTEAISRAEAGEMSPDEMDILTSFLRAGFETPEGTVTYDPGDYYRELEKGFVPIGRQTAATQYAF